MNSRRQVLCQVFNTQQLHLNLTLEEAVAVPIVQMEKVSVERSRKKLYVRGWVDGRPRIQTQAGLTLKFLPLAAQLGHPMAWLQAGVPNVAGQIF